jgi:hypothetical protein
MRIARTVRRWVHTLQAWSLAASRHRFAPGSKPWLIGTEAHYGGLVMGVSRNKVSPRDHRSDSELSRGGMIGGDRMLHHGYAGDYAEFLAPFLGADPPPVVAEFGILRGTGLAIWCDLFPRSRVLGLDIDLGHFRANRPNLEARGAFKANQPELHEFDQLEREYERVGSVLAGDRIDICIDDGLHSEESIMLTLARVAPHLAERFVIFIEDHAGVHALIRAEYPSWVVRSHGEMTVITPS